MLIFTKYDVIFRTNYVGYMRNHSSLINDLIKNMRSVLNWIYNIH